MPFSFTSVLPRKSSVVCTRRSPMTIWMEKPVPPALISTPSRSGWFLMRSGVSPIGMFQSFSPVFHVVGSERAWYSGL